jgi:hypothetical protein
VGYHIGFNHYRIAATAAATGRGGVTAQTLPATDGQSTGQAEPAPVRDVVFISKATSGDDEFALWLAPRLEAEGYTVFADILSLQAGDQWRRVLTSTLQDRAVKMLLCCSDETLAKPGVVEEIEIASDVAKEVKDKRFIIPLKLQKHKKLFGIGGLQWIDFEKGWAQGLAALLDALEKQGVPRTARSISPQWEAYRKRLSLKIEPVPETLISNWLRVAEIPDTIRYFEPVGAIGTSSIPSAIRAYGFPAYQHLRGFFAFADEAEINHAVASLGKYKTRFEVPTLQFLESGLPEFGVRQREASNMLIAMFRHAWETFCEEKGLRRYAYSRSSGFHAADGQVAIGKKIPWGRQGDRRSAMLRNVARGKVWNYGVSAIPYSWPYLHFRLKARVLFADYTDGKPGDVIGDDRQQFRLRRTVCKGWRNKQWHGRLMAFLEMLSGDSAFLHLPASPSASIKLEATPVLFTSPVSTLLPDRLADEEEEADASTLGNRDIEEDDA